MGKSSLAFSILEEISKRGKMASREIWICACRKVQMVPRLYLRFWRWLIFSPSVWVPEKFSR
jgi:hypothetical protein